MPQNTVTIPPLAEPCRIRVLGAPPIQPARAVLSRRVDTAQWPVQAFWFYALVNISAYLWLGEVPALTSALVFVRYLLWPATLVFAAIFVSLKGVTPIFRALLPFLPYFFVGLASGLASVAPLDALRLLVFWILVMLTAALVGLQLRPETTIKTTFFTFAVFVTTSVAFVLLVPSLGIPIDNRSATGGAWRGLFEGKNLFGEICVYAFVSTLLVRGINLRVRLIVAGLAVLALIKSDSQGAVVLGASITAYWLCVPQLRKMALSPLTKSGIFVGSIIGGVLVLLFANKPLLEALGRDPTFTGRTVIWALWLSRATHHWILGAGPGSFTLVNSVTVSDLVLAFQKYGSIHTPHNMYIAIFGEVGLLGLVAFAVPLIYLMAYLPFRYAGRTPFACGMVAFTTAVSGMSETREVFGIGLNMSLLILLYASTIRQLNDALVETAPPDHNQIGQLSVLG